jgi:oligopeptide transport system permease protein
VAPLEETPLQEIDSVSVAAKPSNLWRDAWHDVRKRVLFYVSAAVVLLVVVVALAPGLFSSLDPTHCELQFSNDGPSSGHILGSTKQGCDVFSRVVHGAGTSLAVGLLSVLIAVVIGVIMGALAGYYGGWFDAVLSRVGDIFFSIPYILAAIVVMSVLSEYRNVFVISIAIGGFSWPSVARILRSEILRVKNSDFVTASQAIGLSPFRTMATHVLPNSIAPVIVIATLMLGSAIVAEATLSFLGVGLPGKEVMSWGKEIALAQSDLRTNPMTLIYPSLALTITVLGFITLGEVIRDALDPKARAQR